MRLLQHRCAFSACSRVCMRDVGLQSSSCESHFLMMLSREPAARIKDYGNGTGEYNLKEELY